MWRGSLPFLGSDANDATLCKMGSVQPDDASRARSEHPPARLFDLSPLGHPVWWLALALLLVNDNLLKGAGAVPAWLTGKLSDFAFLVVAPVLLTSLLPVRLRTRRGLAFLAVSMVFAAGDLSTSASNAIVALAGRLGFRWRLWPDVTDLVALTVLPVSWWIAGSKSRLVVYSGQRLLQRVAVVLGAAACLATSAPPSWPHYPFFVNHTTQSQTVTFTWLLRKIDCNGDLSQVAAGLDSGDLDEPHGATLTAGQVAALDVPPASSATIGGVCQNSSSPNSISSGDDCTAVLVTASNGPSVLISAQRHWRESNDGGSFISCDSPPAPTSVCASVIPSGQDPGEDALSLDLNGGQLAFKAGKNLKLVAVDPAVIMARPAAANSCQAMRGQIRALIDTASTCSTDADCQVVTADIQIPGSSICNVYVNRSLTFSTLANAKSQWDAACLTDDTFYCGGGYAQVQPAVCRSGTCGELCPGINLPVCPAVTCESRELTPGGSCVQYAGADCIGPGGQYCTCTGQGSTLVCQPPSQVVPGCSIPCMSDYPISTSGPNAYAVDASVLDARSDAMVTDTVDAQHEPSADAN